MGRCGAGAQRSAAAERCMAGAERITGRAERIASSPERITGSPERITGRAWQHRGGRSPGRAASSRQPITGRAGQHRGGRSPGRAGQLLATDPPAAGGQGLKAAKSSRAKDESPTGILSTHVHVAAEKNFFTPRRGVILAEKRPFPARGRKPCYDFCVGRESPPAKQKLHSADHGAERISP